MPDSLIDQRERNNEKLKSKGRTERKRQWESQVKGSSVLPDISKGMASCWKGCVNLFCSQVDRDKLSLHELNQGTLVYSQAEEQGHPGTPLSMIIIIKAMKKQVKETLSNMESELASSLQQYKVCLQADLVLLFANIAFLIFLWQPCTEQIYWHHLLNS